MKKLVCALSLGIILSINSIVHAAQEEVESSPQALQKNLIEQFLNLQLRDPLVHDYSSIEDENALAVCYKTLKTFYHNITSGTHEYLVALQTAEDENIIKPTRNFVSKLTRQRIRTLYPDESEVFVSIITVTVNTAQEDEVTKTAEIMKPISQFSTDNNIPMVSLENYTKIYNARTTMLLENMKTDWESNFKNKSDSNSSDCDDSK